MNKLLSPRGAPRRVGIATAKARFSEIVRDTAQGPTLVNNRGRDVAVIVDIEEWQRIAAETRGAGGAGPALLDDLRVLRERAGSGVDDFVPERLALRLPIRRLGGKR